MKDKFKDIIKAKKEFAQMVNKRIISGDFRMDLDQAPTATTIKIIIDEFEIEVWNSNDVEYTRIYTIDSPHGSFSGDAKADALDTRCRKILRDCLRSTSVSKKSMKLTEEEIAMIEEYRHEE